MYLFFFMQNFYIVKKHTCEFARQVFSLEYSFTKKKKKPVLRQPQFHVWERICVIFTRKNNLEFDSYDELKNF